MKKLMTNGFLLICMLLSCALFAQERQIKGVVLDETGSPLPGASITVKGSNRGVSTDFDGAFNITASNTDVLVISYVGYANQEITVGNQTDIRVTMSPDVSSLDEVVVVGFGVQKKSNLTGAASTIKMDEVLADRPVTNPILALQGAVPGLQVTSNSGRPGANGLGINIRGTNSINGGSPLILVDNVPIGTENINPQDVESVTVLKDAAASSIYGARAAFGVILITTKKGSKDQPVKFNYSNTIGFSQPEDIPDKAPTYDFVNALDDWGVDSFWTGQHIDTWVGFLEEYRTNPSTYPEGYALYDGLRYPLKDTDLIGAFLNDEGFSQIHNISFSGGSSKTSYRVSAAFSDEDGIIVEDNDSYKKYNLNANLTTDLTDKLTASMNVMYRNSVRYDPVGSFGNAMSFNPYTPEGGNHVFEDGTEIPYFTPANMERLSIAPKNLVDNVRVFSKMDFTPIKDLTITGEYTFQQSGTDRITGHNQILTVNPERFTLNAVSNDNTYYQKQSSKTQYHVLNLYSKYQKSIDDHNFSLLAGFNNEQSEFETFWVRRTNLISVDLPSISGASGTITADDGFTQWSVLGVFGRFKYNYKEKYFLEANGRYDGSSKFPKEDRYGFFPSFSVGWAISKEPFMENIEWLSDLKLRASYGEIGNQNTSSAYPAVPGMPVINASWLNSSAGVPYVTLGMPALVSASFTWEEVRSQNIGFDARFLDGRLSASLDVFTRETIGMLDEGVELPGVLGTDAPEQNVADLKATGWETQVNWRDKVGDFRYNIGVSLFDNQTEMTKVRNEAGLIGQHYVGRMFGEIWGYETDRYYTVEDFVPGSLDENQMNGTLIEGIPNFRGRNPNPGDILFVDQNGDGEIFSGNNTLDDPGDRKIIGNSTKRYQYGIYGGAGYKNFDFSFVINGVGKKDVYINNSSMFPYTNEFQVVYKDQLDYWTPENTDAFYPRNYALGAVNYGTNRQTQTKYLLNGAYMRIKNVTLGYTVPQSALSKFGIDNLRVYVSGENLFDFDHVPDGINPELANLGNGATYPYMRNYSMGINLSF